MAELRPSGAAPGPRAQDMDRYVGAKMRERRMMLGLSQQQLADLISAEIAQETDILPIAFVLCARELSRNDDLRALVHDLGHL